MSSNSSESDIETEAQNIINGILPEKSKEQYIKIYEDFIKWKNSKKVESITESLLLVYFHHLSLAKKPSSLWCIYSMLKSTLNIKHNIEIEKYSKLKAFLKRKSEGHRPRKSRVFTAQNIETFLNDAPDQLFLDKKVVLIFGINGACRTGELLNIKTEDITEYDNHLLLINLPDTKTRRERSFVIRSSYAEIVKKYLNLRPPNMKTDRFFINYFNGKCTRQVIGKNKISAMPKKIAEYLKLPNPELYTGHCLRRTSATLLAESGADMTQIKRHGGWRSDAVAEGYVENSLQNKNDISCHIGTSIKLKNIQCSLDNMRSTVPQPSTSAHIEQVPSPPKPSTSTTAPFLQAPPSPTYTVENNLQSQTHNMAATENETYTQFNSTSSTAINKPNKNITLSFHNWTNVSNITFNF